MKEYSRLVFTSLLPAFLLFAGKSAYISTWVDLQNWLPASFTKSEFEFYCFLLGIIGSSLVVPIQLVWKQKDLKKKDSLLTALVVFNRSNFLETLGRDLKKPNISLRTRIFTPDPKPFWQKWSKESTINYTIREIDGLTEPLHATHLSFQVEPNPEGVIGKVYSEQKIVIYHDQELPQYNLSVAQKQTTADVCFCCAGPIFNKKGKVVAVLAVDSTSTCTLDYSDTSACEKTMAMYCSFVGKNVNL